MNARQIREEKIGRVLLPPSFIEEHKAMSNRFLDAKH